jgi:hypothetical protein
VLVKELTVAMSKDEKTREVLNKTAARVSSYAIASFIQPIDLLKEAIENKKWFEGLILSATFFELFGFITLKTYYEVKKGKTYRTKIGELLKRMGLMNKILLLYLCDFIRPKTYDKMRRIVKERNNLVHRVRRINNDFAFETEISTEDKEKAIKLTAEAIECLKELGIS